MPAAHLDGKAQLLGAGASFGEVVNEDDGLHEAVGHVVGAARGVGTSSDAYFAAADIAYAFVSSHGHGSLSAQFRSSWEDDGWCVIDSALPVTEVRAAQAALAHLFPSAEEMDSGRDDERTAPWRTWDAAWPEFPFRSRSLNGLVVHDVVLNLAEELLGTNDVRLYLALVTAKYANQSSGYNQLLHTDYPNHTLVVPRRDVGYQHLELLIYLSDVTASNGATRMVSRRKTADIPVERHTLSFHDYGHLYEEAGEASGTAGSIVAYRPDVYHRSVDVTEPGASRFILHVAYRPTIAEWGGYQAWPFKGFSPDWNNFVQYSNPRALGVLGFPKPGHLYWTEETLAGVAARYPGLDMTPWWDGQRQSNDAHGLE
jgi:hypothetical protein